MSKTQKWSLQCYRKTYVITRGAPVSVAWIAGEGADVGWGEEQVTIAKAWSRICCYRGSTPLPQG